MTPEGSIYYYHNYHLGTPLAMTDEQGNIVWKAAYDPFGRAEVDPSSSVTNNFRFPGQYYDAESELHYNWHRYYDPETGRYVTADPSHYKNQNIPYLVSLLVLVPQELNNYSYVRNNPMLYIDPQGLSCGPGFFGDFVIPDRWLWFSFADACQRHDNCYGCEGEKAKKSKNQCDLEFLNNMLKECYVFNKGSYWQNNCESMAQIYYSAVRDHGDDAFNKAREKCRTQCR